MKIELLTGFNLLEGESIVAVESFQDVILIFTQSSVYVGGEEHAVNSFIERGTK